MSNLRNRLSTRATPKFVEVTDTFETGNIVPVLDKDGKPELDGKNQPKMEPESKTETYTLKGLPDDYSLTIGMMGDQEQAKQAALYNAHLIERWKDSPADCPSKFTKEDVYKIKLVAHYLQPEPVLGEDGKPVVVEGVPQFEQPLSEYEIAFMSKEMGPLFIKLFAESVKIANNKTGARVGDVEIQEDPMVTVGLGKSETGETESSPSP